MAQIARLEKKLKGCMEAEEFYEAHQIYRTIYYRLNSQQKFDELLPLLYLGALEMEKAEQHSSAYDLAELFVDTLVAAKTPASPSVLDNIEKLLRDLPAFLESDKTLNSYSDRRTKIIATAVKWSRSIAVKNREMKRGLSELHFRLARVFSDQREFDAARTHFLLAERPQEFAQFLISTSECEDLAVDADSVFGQSVLQMLCLHRVKTASRLFTEYCTNNPKIQTKQPPYADSLLNFIALVILSIPKHNINEFTRIVERYHSVIEKDCMYKKYIDKIGQLFFGVPPPVNQMGMLGGMLKGLLGGDKQEEEEVFSDSDVEVRNSFINEFDDDGEGYLTAEDEDDEPSPRPPPAAANLAHLIRNAAATPPKPAQKMEIEEDLD